MGDSLLPASLHYQSKMSRTLSRYVLWQSLPELAMSPAIESGWQLLIRQRKQNSFLPMNLEEDSEPHRANQLDKVKGGFASMLGALTRKCQCAGDRLSIVLKGARAHSPAQVAFLSLSSTTGLASGHSFVDFTVTTPDVGLELPS